MSGPGTEVDLLNQKCTSRDSDLVCGGAQMTLNLLAPRTITLETVKLGLGHLYIFQPPQMAQMYSQR